MVGYSSKTDSMTGADKNLPQKSSKAAIDEFLEKVSSTPVNKSAGERGRLIFAMDATASRKPAWDRACHGIRLVCCWPGVKVSIIAAIQVSRVC